MRTKLENIILVSGTGRNVGKTIFACKIIQRFKGQSIGLKISPHPHTVMYKDAIVFESHGFLIFRETITDGIKDSSKMFISGAKASFYIQAKDEYLLHAFQYLHQNHIHDQPVVCESAALGKHVQPAVHFRIALPGQPDEKEGHGKIPYDYLVVRDGIGYDFDIGRISLTNNIFHLK
jgi:hypothetical protein